jgi:hypothetical protein
MSSFEDQIECAFLKITRQLGKMKIRCEGCLHARLLASLLIQSQSLDMISFLQKLLLQLLNE